MRSELRIETKVLPGNKIEINLPADMLSSSVGQTIEVIVMLPERPQLMRQNILEWIEHELEFIWEDVTKILQSMKVGSDRISHEKLDVGALDL